MFGKEKKLKKAQEEERAREDAEFEAKFAARRERKNVEKIVADMEKTTKSLLVKAAEAKKKGQTTVYRNYVTTIKVARARKQQAENFLAQVDVMQEMQSITNSSKALLSSMGSIMNSLGKLTLDRSAILESQRDFAATQRELDKQGMTIEQFLSGMEMNLPEDESAYADMSGVDKEIDAEVDSIILGGSASSAGTGTAPAAESGSSDNDRFMGLLNS